MSPSPYSFPPGLVGDLARFIHDAAPRPVPEIALAGAIGLMAGVCGRAFNVSGTGLNQYVLLIAETGTGKEAINSGISALMKACRTSCPVALSFVGPAHIRSDAALLKQLAKSPAFVSVLGEFGLTLQQMANPRAPSHLASVKQILLDIYNKSGAHDVLNPMVYSDQEKNTPPIDSPALSVIGETTPGRLYEALDEGLITDGLLPRFTIIEYRGDRPEPNDYPQRVPSPELVNAFANLCAFVAARPAMAQPLEVRFSPEANAILLAFRAECDANIIGKPDVFRHLWTRAHMKAMKLAAVVAVGDARYGTPEISGATASWAVELERNCALNLLSRFENGETGAAAGSEAAQQAEVIRIIGEYMTAPHDRVANYNVVFEMHRDMVVTQTYLSRRVLKLPIFRDDKIGASNALARTLKNLLEGDELREVPKSQMVERYGRHPRAFVVADAARFAPAPRRK